MNATHGNTAKVFRKAAKEALKDYGFWSCLPVDCELDRSGAALWEWLDYWARKGGGKGNPAAMDAEEHCLFFCFMATLAESGDYLKVLR